MMPSASSKEATMSLVSRVVETHEKGGGGGGGGDGGASMRHRVKHRSKHEL